MLYFRKALVILCGLIAIRRHVCLVNDHVFMFDHLEYLTSISGETFFSGRWFGGSFTNFKKM
jgi:ribosomal protein S2